MPKFLRKTKIVGLTIALVVIGALMMATWQNLIIGVSAQLDPIMLVTPENLQFGLSFPQEKRRAEFIVEVAGSHESIIYYQITHERKPLPAGYEGDGEDPNMPGYYRDLCPYLTETIVDAEPDTVLEATLYPNNPAGEDDIIDYWQVLFDVPTIKGFIDQGFVGIPVDAPGDYGCDIKVATIAESECEEGEQRACSTGEPGICDSGTRTCYQFGEWGSCQADNQPTTENCTNGLDDDCDEDIDCNDSDCLSDSVC